MGYDVYFNVTKEADRYKDCKHSNLTVGEVYALSELSKKIIGLRSGLMDLLVYAGKPMDVIYTKARERNSFNPLTSGEILTGFTMENYSNVREFDADVIGNEELLEAVG